MNNPADAPHSDATDGYVEWEYAACVSGTVACGPDEHPRLSVISGGQDDVAESVTWRRAGTDDPWAGPTAAWHVNIAGYAPPTAVPAADEEHTWEHVVASYRDALAVVDAARRSDEMAVHLIASETDCASCLLESVAQIAARTGDSRAAQQAAHDRLRALREEIG